MYIIYNIYILYLDYIFLLFYFIQLFLVFIFFLYILNMYLKISRKRGGGCEQSLVYTHTRAKIYVRREYKLCNIFAKRLKFNIL